MDDPVIGRREFVRLTMGAAGAVGLGASLTAPEPLAQAAIPATGQRIARIGIGTWQTFDVGADATRRPALTETLQRFVDAGGDLIDTSPMYGSSEAVLGDLTAAAGLRDRLFLATKVWTSGETAGV